MPPAHEGGRWGVRGLAGWEWQSRRSTNECSWLKGSQLLVLCIRSDLTLRWVRCRAGAAHHAAPMPQLCCPAGCTDGINMGSLRAELDMPQYFRGAHTMADGDSEDDGMVMGSTPGLRSVDSVVSLLCARQR